MKDKQKRKILVLGIIVILIIIVVVIFCMTQQKSKEDVQTKGNRIEQINENEKVNSTDKLKKEKIVGDYKVKEITISQNGDMATISMLIENVKESEKVEQEVKIDLLDEKGNNIMTVGRIFR